MIREKDKAAQQWATKADPYKILEDTIKLRPGNPKFNSKTHRRHHDLVIQTGGKQGTIPNLQIEFLKRGLDPNDGLILLPSGRYVGRLVPIKFHENVLHGWYKRGWGKTPSGGMWNYQWMKFFENNVDATADDILIFLDELLDATSDYTKTSVLDIDWPIPPPTP